MPKLWPSRITRDQLGEGAEVFPKTSPQFRCLEDGVEVLLTERPRPAPHCGEGEQSDLLEDQA
jgi:hypothetical protein